MINLRLAARNLSRNRDSRTFRVIDQDFGTENLFILRFQTAGRKRCHVDDAHGLVVIEQFQRILEHVHAEGTGGHDGVCSRRMSLFYPNIVDPFPALEIHEIMPAPGTAAVVAFAVGIHVREAGCALTCDPAAFLEVAVSERLEGFSPIVAGIVIGGELRMAGGIQLDSAFFEVAHEKVKY